MTTEALAALGAFLSGVGSVISAAWYVKIQRKKWDEDCRRRLEAFRQGIELEWEHEKSTK